MIILEDHILQAELNNVTRILFARAYPLLLIIKNIKKALTHSRNYLLSQQTPDTETNIFPVHYNPFLRHGQTTHSHYTQKLAHCCQQHHTLFHLAIQPTPNPTLFTLHKHMLPHGETPRTTTHTHPHTPKRTYPHITTVVTPVFSSIPDTPNSSSCHGQWIEC